MLRVDEVLEADEVGASMRPSTVGVMSFFGFLSHCGDTEMKFSSSNKSIEAALRLLGAGSSNCGDVEPSTSSSTTSSAGFNAGFSFSLNRLKL